jgi:hypothetical protein
MNNKISKTFTPLSNKQFDTIWLRTGKDPDGKTIQMFTSGGKHDSYKKWILKKKTEYLSKVEIEKKINIENQIRNDSGGEYGEVEVKSVDSVKYKWVSDGSDCQTCKALNGRVFNSMPNKEGLSHPNCKCQIVEVSGVEGERISISQNGMRWQSKWDNSKIGKGKFSPYGKERMLQHYDKPKIHRGDDITLPSGTKTSPLLKVEGF